MPRKGWKKTDKNPPLADAVVNPPAPPKPERKKRISIEMPTEPKLETPLKQKDDLGPETKTGSKEEHTKVIIVWKDARGKEKSVQYIMAEVEAHESLDSIFEGPKKKTHFHLTIDGMVLEKI